MNIWNKGILQRQSVTPCSLQAGLEGDGWICLIYSRAQLISPYLISFATKLLDVNIVLHFHLWNEPLLLNEAFFPLLAHSLNPLGPIFMTQWSQHCDYWCSYRVAMLEGFQDFDTSYLHHSPWFQLMLGRRCCGTAGNLSLLSCRCASLFSQWMGCTFCIWTIRPSAAWSWQDHGLWWWKSWKPLNEPRSLIPLLLGKAGMDCGEGPSSTIHCDVLPRHFDVFSNKYILMDKSWNFLLLKYLSLPALRMSKLLQVLFVRIQHLMSPILEQARLWGRWQSWEAARSLYQVSLSELPWAVCALFWEHDVLSRWPHKLCHWLCQENKEMNTGMCAPCKV